MSSNKKILVGEDDTFLASAYKVKLEGAGFIVAIANDGNEVLTIADNFTPDLILLDIIMPVRHGLVVLKDLKKGIHKNIPVIIASNLGQTEDIKKGIALGAVDYIVKSDTSLEEIIAKINKYI